MHWSCNKHDIPKGACYTASWKDCGRTMYVGSVRRSRKEFEDFTIKILNFSNLIKEVKFTGASGVKYSPATARRRSDSTVVSGIRSRAEKRADPRRDRQICPQELHVL